jgi:thymidylate synthase ThyX
MISAFVTNESSNVYALRNLPEEVAAVLFAYYSRSKGTLRENLERLLQGGELGVCSAGGFDLAAAEGKAAAFHDKWVVGYGHGSVAEHAVVHVAVENCSIHAAKVIEDCRLGAYTEKSTRYVKYEADRIYRPVLPHDLAAVYGEAVASLMAAYDQVHGAIYHHLDSTTTRGFSSDAVRRNVLNGTACDAARYLLPIGALTNLGISMNGRTAGHMIKKLRASDLPEIQGLAEKLHREVEKVLPTLVKYCDAPSPYRTKTPTLVRQWIEENWEEAYNTDGGIAVPGAQFGKHDSPDEREALWKVCAAILWEELRLPYDKIRCRVRWLGRAELVDLLKRYCRERAFVIKKGTPEERIMHEQVLRAFEEVTVPIEFVCDYGAWRDIQRHRMATQYRQDFHWGLGYETPDLVVQLGLQEPYRRAMDRAGIAFKRLRNAGVPDACYALPLGWKVRSRFVMNLRELDHFVQLRSGRQGNPSYRRLAQGCWDNLQQRLPAFAELIPCDFEEYDLTRH